MSISNIGVSQPQSYAEQETQAIQTKIKTALGMAEDSSDIPFTNLGNVLVGGRSSPFSYTTSSSTPLLDFFLIQNREGTGRRSSDDRWKGVFNGLMAQLPLELLNEYILDNQKPFEERNLLFTVLDNILLGYAQTTANLRELIAPEAQTVEATTFAQKNSALVPSLLKQTEAQCQKMLEGAQHSMNAIGPNDPNFDGLLKFSGEVKALLNDLNLLF